MYQAPPRPSTKCCRCGEGYSEHDAPELHCPDGSESTYVRHVPRPGASQSFSPTEIAVLDKIVRGLLAGSDLRPFARLRAADLGKLLGKALAMRRTSASRAQLRVIQGGQGTP